MRSFLVEFFGTFSAEKIAAVIAIIASIFASIKYIFGSSKIRYSQIEIDRLSFSVKPSQSIFYLKNTRFVASRDIEVIFSSIEDDIMCYAHGILDPTPIFWQTTNEKKQTVLSIKKIDGRNSIYVVLKGKSDLLDVKTSNGISEHHKYNLFVASSDFVVWMRMIIFVTKCMIIPFFILAFFGFIFK